VANDLVEFNILIGFLVGVITIVTAVAGLFKYKWNQAISNVQYKFSSSSDRDKLAERIDDLCKKLEQMRKDMKENFDRITQEMQSEVIAAKEEHAGTQIKIQELFKEMYKLIGQVNILVNKK